MGRWKRSVRCHAVGRLKLKIALQGLLFAAERGTQGGRYGRNVGGRCRSVEDVDVVGCPERTMMHVNEELVVCQKRYTEDDRITERGDDDRAYGA